MGGDDGKKKKKRTKKKEKTVTDDEPADVAAEKSDDETSPRDTKASPKSTKKPASDDASDEEESLDDNEKQEVAEDAKTKKKSVVSRSIGLSEHNPSRGSIMLSAKAMGTLLNPNTSETKAGDSSPALDRRGLKLQRRGSANLDARKEANEAAPAPATPRQFANDRERCVDLAKRAGLQPLVKLMDSKKKFTKANAEAAVLALYQTDSNTVGVEADGLKAFVKLAQSKKPAVQCTALWSLVTILGIAFSGEDDATQRRVVDEGALKLGLSLLDSSHHEVPMAAAALLGNVVLFEESREKLIKKGGLEKLMQVATPDNLPLARTALVAIANLVAEEENVKAVRAAGGIEWLLKMAKLEDAECRQAAVAGLSNIANSKYQHELMDAGVLDLVAPLLSPDGTIVARAAAQTVSNLTLVEANRPAVLARVVQDLMRLANSRDVRVQHCCATALNNLAQDDKARQTIIDSGGEPAVKKLMFSVDEDVRHESELLFKALTHDQKPPEKQKVKRSDRMDRVSSKRFVLGIFEQYKTQRKAKSAESIDPIEILLAKLADYLNGILPTPDVVVSTIKNVETQAAQNPKNDKLLREMAGIQLLVSMIPEFDTHPEILRQTLNSLHMLVRLNPRNILAVADVDIAVDEFLKCLEVPAVGKLDVINLLGALADVEKTRDEIVSRGGITQFVRILRDTATPLDVQGSTLEVLAKLAIEKTETQFAIETQALPTIFELLQSAASTDVQCQLLRLLSALAFNNRRLQEVIRKEEKIEPIIGFTRSNNYLIQEYAVRALLTFIANDHKNKEAARKFGAIKALTDLLDSEVDMVLKSAVRGISELSLANMKNKNEFRKEGALPKLVKLLDTALVNGDAAAASDATAREMAEMVDCTRTTYVLECISVLCSSCAANQSTLAGVTGALAKLDALLDSIDLREVYHAINTIGAVCKNSKKCKKDFLAAAPYALQKVDKLTQYQEARLAQLAQSVNKMLRK